MIRVLHVVTDLRMGGAEATLAQLVEQSEPTRSAHHVIGLKGDGPIGHRLRAAGATVEALGLRAPWQSAIALATIRRRISRWHPEVVQGWMYHGNVAAKLAVMGMKAPPAMSWNIRHSLVDITREKPMTARMIRLGARMSAGVDLILWNAAVSRVQHEAVGYHGRRHMVLANGVDTSRMKPCPAARTRMRADLGLSDRALLVGSVARFHPMKGHARLLDAIAQMADRGRDVHLALCGRGCEAGGPAAKLVQSTPPLQDRVHLLGEVEDPQPIYAALDCFVTASRWGESFPNALVEAMACGVPAVATDLGAAAEILGDRGCIVSAEDSADLVPAIDRMLHLPAQERVDYSVRARRRVEQRYNAASAARRYERVWATVAEQRR